MAVLSNDVDLLKRLLVHQKSLDPTWFTKPGKGINAVAGKHENNALMEALDYHRGDMAKLLIEYGTDVHQLGDGGETALVKAASNKQLDVVKLLLERGADPNVTYSIESRGTTYPVLSRAIGSSHFDIANALIEAGAKVDFVDQYGSTFLHEVAKHTTQNKSDGISLVRKLLSLGLSLEARNKDGETPLAEAIWGGNAELVTLLCKAGSDLTTRLKKGESLLKFALEHDRPEAARALVACGANDPAVTPLLLAVLTDNENELKVFLAKSGLSKAELNATLVYAIRKNRTTAAIQLLKQGADPNTPDTDYISFGPTPLLYHAIRLKDVALAEALLVHGADPSAEFAYNPKNMLAHAIAEKQPQIVKLLHSHGARQVSEQLHYFAYDQPLLFVEALKRTGLDPKQNSKAAEQLTQLLKLDNESQHQAENILNLFSAHQQFPSAGLATLLRQLLPADILFAAMDTKCRNAIDAGDINTLDACIELIPAPGIYMMYVTHEEQLKSITPAILERVLAHRFRLNANNTFKYLLLWLYKHGQPDLAARFITAYPQPTGEELIREIPEVAASNKSLASFVKAYPKIDRCLALKIAADQHDSSALITLSKGVDLLGCLKKDGVDHFNARIKNNFEEGLLALAVNKDPRSDATVATVLKLLPRPPDVALAVQRAAEYNRFDVLQRLYSAHLLNDINIDTLGLDNQAAGYIYLSLLRKAVPKQLIAQDLLVTLSRNRSTGITQLLEQMVKQGADVNKPDSTGHFALAIAGDNEVRNWLIAHGANLPVVMNAMGSAPWYSGTLDLAMIKQLTSETKSSTPHMENALMNAARHGQLDVVDYLLEQGASGRVGYADDALRGTFSAIDYAAMMGRTVILEHLLKAAPLSPEAKSHALKYAINEGQFYCARLLLAGENSGQLIIDMKPARDYARANNRNPRILELFK